MDLKKASSGNLLAIMRIIAEAQQFLKSLGVDQWQNGYPSEEIINNDIEHGNGYILTVADEVVAFATVIFAEEPTYANIYDGQWLTGSEYAVIHRMAVANTHKEKGYGQAVYREIERMALTRKTPSLRVDTHEDNIPMQKLITKSGYTYCGVIYLMDGSKRIAFERIVRPAHF
ncbi:GNAT family N-acetyltransferase [Bacteroidales bacterium OttesenSCG-928-B11]|nr:GNAT family N-acetyltransferase [Bacteroidales bacterium OttesenSCG-928-C03]MDL2311653.1 GNAT family N-acetyltransferase [Bacteroidales bacterium OttesenSCG-928-B11]